jgi:hypothetical protein
MTQIHLLQIITYVKHKIKILKNISLLFVSQFFLFIYLFIYLFIIIIIFFFCIFSHFFPFFRLFGIYIYLFHNLQTKKDC